MELIGALDDAMGRMTKARQKQRSDSLNFVQCNFAINLEMVISLPGTTMNKTPTEPLEDMGRPPLTESLKLLKKENFTRKFARNLTDDDGLNSVAMAIFGKIAMTPRHATTLARLT
eukprot:scaffold615418_cov45-Prasinocladus_malaysianus.AAC.1